MTRSSTFTLGTLLAGLSIVCTPLVFAQSTTPGMTVPQNSSGRQPAHPDTSGAAGMEGEASNGSSSMHDLSGANGASGSSGASETRGSSASGNGYAEAGLQPRTQGDITYVCGGVGAGEASAMRKAAADYDLMLTFAAKDGSYLADVDVTLLDASNKPVLQTQCDGPMMLVDLPRSGTYTVRAETEGRTVGHQMRVNTRNRKAAPENVVLSWPMDVLGQPGAETMSGSSGAAGTSAAGRGDTTAKSRMQDRQHKQRRTHQKPQRNESAPAKPAAE